MEEVVENKNLPGNGLTDSVSPEEVEPLQKKKGFFSRGKKVKVVLNAQKEFDDMEGEGEGEVVMMDHDDQLDYGEDPHDREPSPDYLANCAHKCRLSPKRGLIYLIACAFIIFVLILILIIVAASWPKTSILPICHSAQCHSFSAQVLGAMNETAGPCDDFWEFSCGGWLRSHPIPKSQASWSVDQLEQFHLKAKLRDLINTLPYYEPTSEVNNKMKRFYQSCMGREYIEVEEERPLKKIIQMLGGWQVLRNFRQNEFDFPRVLRKLHGEYRTSPFFQIQVVPDPRNPTRNIIKINPAGLSLPDKSYYSKREDRLASAFRTFAKDVVQLLGATSYQATQFADEIFYFEKRISEIYPDPLSLRDPIRTYNKLSVGELRAKSNTIFWPDLLKAVFPQGTINDQTEVVAPSVQYLEDISSIISATDKGNLNNYLMWHLTLKYLPYLSKKYTEVYDMYRRESTGSTKPVPRWEFCMANVIQFFPHGVNYLLANHCDEREERIAKVEAMFESMKHNLGQRISDSNKYAEVNMRNLATDKLKLMGITIGTPLLNKTSLEDLYLSLDVQKDDFFTNILVTTSFQLQSEQKNLAHPKASNVALNAIAASPFSIQFIPTSNRIVVPETFLQRSVLSLPDGHWPLVYGSAGVEIAEGLAQAFGPELGLYGSTGALMSERDPKAQESRDMIESKRTCLKSFFTKIRLDDEDYVDRTSLDTTMHLAGIQIAVDTLKGHAFYDEFQGLPSLDQFTASSLFFLAYGQTQCSASTLLFHDMEHATFTSFSHDHRTRGVLRQLVGFTKAFGCSKHSEMYADFSCGYVI